MSPETQDFFSKVFVRKLDDTSPQNTRLRRSFFFVRELNNTSPQNTRLRSKIPLKELSNTPPQNTRLQRKCFLFFFWFAQNPAPAFLYALRKKKNESPKKKKTKVRKKNNESPKKNTSALSPLRVQNIGNRSDIINMSTKRSFYLRLLRGTIVNRTYGIHKNLYISLFLLRIFGPVNYGPP